MSTRKDKLQRLQVASPCSSSWEAMHGDGRRRHCLQCDKSVYDFAQLTPREIAGVIEASQGKLCGRLTRDGWGRLLTLEPPPVTADPLPSRRGPALATAVVAAVLGLSGAAWTDPAAPVSPAAEQGTGERPEGNRPQRTGNAGSSLSGRLTNEAGEPVPDAEIKLYNQLDRQERARRTDAEGRFSFASVTAGIYELRATAGGHDAAQQGNILLSAGEKRQIGLTVPSRVWESIVAGEPAGLALGGVIFTPEEPLHSLYEEASLVVLGVAGKSVTVRQQDYTGEVRTEIVISSVLKGDTRERVISVYHNQMPDEDPENRLQPGNNVLVFLNPREAENGRGSDGYVAADALSGLRELADEELAAYQERIEALAQIPESGAARPAEFLEWLVATTEDPATRKEAIDVLSGAVQQLEHQAEQRKIPVDLYAQSLQDVFVDFLSAGGTPEREVNPVILAAFLTDAHRERLSSALLGTSHAEDADLTLYELVGPWHDDRLLPWLIDQLETAKLSGWAGQRLMANIAEALDDASLANLLAAGVARFSDLEGQIYNASEDAERQRLGRQLEEAEEALRRQLIEALGRGTAAPD
ncbi:MAG TPA: carboxypeptidase-like regulatory domain-containing protein [Thermoanaerobaculia bacterium]|nr:carboxypeptidase-like regulatory domain-containing protein [Thermoanaerobaculia bacterium]